MKSDYQRLADFFLSVSQPYETGEDFQQEELWLVVHENVYIFTLEGTYKSVETA